MLKYVGVNLTSRDPEYMYSYLSKTKVKDGFVLRVFYSALLDTNVWLSKSDIPQEVLDRLQLTLIFEKPITRLRLVKNENQTTQTSTASQT